MKIKDLILKSNELIEKEIEISGWIRFKRISKNIGFIEIFDGSYLNGIQIVVKSENNELFEEIKNLPLFSALTITGKLVQGKNNLEVLLGKIVEVFESSEEYQLGKKEHGLEFLRENAHFRPRTKLFQSIMKVRSNIALSVHHFFNKENFLYVHTPIITGNDAEGAGEAFYVKTKDNKPFFTNQGSLTVSGQLHAEGFAQAFSDVYTFGPTFRAENSNTSRHASEFWMIEPESAFKDWMQMMDLGEKMLKFIATEVLDNSKDELLFLEKYYNKNIINTLENIVSKNFKKISYTKAIEILNKAVKNGINFEERKIEFGIDLATEHEKYLASVYAEGPIYVYDYPKEIKSFYMYQNDDGKTVRGYDLLVPEIGELIGGSQREDRIDYLIKNLEEKGIDPKEINWYIEMRKFGYAKSTGFGIGFERLVMLFTGVDNIRDSIPFPRTPGKLRY